MHEDFLGSSCHCVHEDLLAISDPVSCWHARHATDLRHALPCPGPACQRFRCIPAHEGPQRSVHIAAASLAGSECLRMQSPRHVACARPNLLKSWAQHYSRCWRSMPTGSQHTGACSTRPVSLQSVPPAHQRLPAATKAPTLPPGPAGGAEELHIHANRRAPRCLPCDYRDPAEASYQANSAFQFTATKACGCSQQAMCAADNSGLFHKPYSCDWASYWPGYWWFGHGGESCVLQNTRWAVPVGCQALVSVDLCSVGHGVCTQSEIISSSLVLTLPLQPLSACSFDGPSQAPSAIATGLLPRQAGLLGTVCLALVQVLA